MVHGLPAGAGLRDEQWLNDGLKNLPAKASGRRQSNKRKAQGRRQKALSSFKL